MTASSNKITYILIGGVVILLIIGFVGYKVMHRNKIAMVQQNNPTAMMQLTPTLHQQSAGTSAASGLSNKTDTSNQQLNQDMQNIQDSMNQLQQDQSTSSQDTTKQSQDVPKQ